MPGDCGSQNATVSMVNAARVALTKLEAADRLAEDAVAVGAVPAVPTGRRPRSDEQRGQMLGPRMAQQRIRRLPPRFQGPVAAFRVRLLDRGSQPIVEPPRAVQHPRVRRTEMAQVV